MNELNQTLKEINVSIAYYTKKKAACEEAIKELESYKKELMDKYDITL